MSSTFNVYPWHFAPCTKECWRWWRSCPGSGSLTPWRWSCQEHLQAGLRFWKDFTRIRIRPSRKSLIRPNFVIWNIPYPKNRIRIRPYFDFFSCISLAAIPSPATILKCILLFTLGKYNHNSWNWSIDQNGLFFMIIWLRDMAIVQPS